MRKKDKQALGVAAVIALIAWWRSRSSSSDKESGVVIDVTKTSGKGGSAHGEAL